MDDFLYILKLQLEGRITSEQIEEQILLYQNYIEEQIAGGKTLDQVMRKLGDPVKIADLIVDSYEKRARAQKSTQANWKNMTADEINAQIQNPEKGFHAEFKENEGWDVRLGNLKLNTWYGTLLILGVVLGISILISQFADMIR